MFFLIGVILQKAKFFEAKLWQECHDYLCMESQDVKDGFVKFITFDNTICYRIKKIIST